MNGNPHNINQIIAVSAQAAEQVREFSYKLYDRFAASVVAVEDLVAEEDHHITTWSATGWSAADCRSSLKRLYKLLGQVQLLGDLDIIARQTRDELYSSIANLIRKVETFEWSHK